MASTLEAAIQELWKASSALQSAVGVDRVHTGPAPEGTGSRTPWVEVQPATQTLVEQPAGAGRIVSHVVVLIVRAPTLDAARNSVERIEAAFDAASLPLTGWVDTWCTGGAASDEGDGVWAVQVELEVWQHKG